jgi:outer membrane receptor protein involved in Fe transport
LTDVVSAMQVQRGLGSSPLPISSVGGTINIVTKSTDLSKGGKVAVRVGNDGYIKKTLNYKTGVMDCGHALSFVFSRTAGDGIVDFTEFEAYSYFLALLCDVTFLSHFPPKTGILLHQLRHSKPFRQY